MLSAILMKMSAGLAGIAFTALGARLVLKIANKMNWEPIFAAAEAAGSKISSLGRLRFNAPFWEPCEEFLQSKVDILWSRFKVGLDLDDKTEQTIQTEQKENVK